MLRNRLMEYPVRALRFSCSGTNTLTTEQTKIHPNWEYSTDGVTWSKCVWPKNNVQMNPVTFGNGTDVFLRGDVLSSNAAQFPAIRFGNTTNLVDCSGNIMYLVDWKQDLDYIPNDEQFSSLFDGATALRTAPLLPALELSRRCYYNMFNNCTNLEFIHDLPAKNVPYQAYYQMFRYCSKINRVRMMATSWDSTSFSSWLGNAPRTGTFIKDSSANLPSGTIPSGWTTINV